MACLKEEFKSRTRINEFNIKKEEFYVFGLSLEIFKDENGIYICNNRKELDKITKEFAIWKNKFASVVVVKTVIFVTNLNLFTNNICNTLISGKLCCGRFN